MVVMARPAPLHAAQPKRVTVDAAHRFATRSRPRR